MDILGFFSSVFGKIDNVAILILLIMLGFMVWLYTQQRKEEREDRRTLLELINRNTEALHAVQQAIAVLGAKVGV